jgi:heme/copper-type cytochrome/quinol oxidase subunit 2
MRSANKKLDFFFLAVIVLVLMGLPFGISFYDRYTASKNIPQGAKHFTLTGHAERGWLIGDVPAYQAVSIWKKKGAPIEKPVIVVSKGDVVVFKLTSSDVVHGFSFKDFEVYLTDGIDPGKATYVSFTADKIGTFMFSCNAICGDMHQNMQGTVIVKA